MNIKLPIELSNLSNDPRSFFKSCTEVLNRITTILGGEVDLTENCKTTFAGVSFAASGVDVAITHGLNRVPKGYIVAGKSVTMDITDGSGSNTTKTLFIRSTAVGYARLLIF